MSLADLHDELEKLRTRTPHEYAQASARILKEIERRNGGSKNPRYGVG